MKFKALEAPRDFDFIDPDTSYQYKENDKNTLMRRIVSYREQNDLSPLDALSAVLDNYWCSKPQNKGLCEQNNQLHRSLWTTIRGGVAVLVNMLYPKVVADEKAEKRAAQCAICPFNEFPDKGAFVSWSDSVAVASIGKKKTSFHEELGNCKVCTCVLKAKVFYDGPVKFDAQQIQDLKSVNCWQLNLPQE